MSTTRYTPEPPPDCLLASGRWANITQKPIVFDPVAVGATEFRRTAADGMEFFLPDLSQDTIREFSELLNAWQASVIKGNPAEIGALAQSAEVWEAVDLTPTVTH